MADGNVDDSLNIFMCQHYLTRKQLTQGDMELKICFQWSLLCSTNTVSSCCEKTDGKALCDACLITWEVPFCCSLCFLSTALPVMANNSTYRLCWFQTSTARSAPVYLWCGFLILTYVWPLISSWQRWKCSLLWKTAGSLTSSSCCKSLTISSSSKAAQGEVGIDYLKYSAMQSE